MDIVLPTDAVTPSRPEARFETNLRIPGRALLLGTILEHAVGLTLVCLAAWMLHEEPRARPAGRLYGRRRIG